VGFVSLVRLITLPSAFALLCSLCVTDVAVAAEFGDVELSAYALGSWPRDLEIFNQETTVPASIRDGFGAGLKVGLFPAALRRMVGLELDSNMHSGAISFPNVANGQNNGAGRSNLLILNTTFNLILRYPGETVRPYVGIGIKILTQPAPWDISFSEGRKFFSAPRSFCSESTAIFRPTITGRVWPWIFVPTMD
jgi:hypothetical protein